MPWGCGAGGEWATVVVTSLLPQCPAWGESLVPGARAGSVPTVHQVSLRSGRSLRVVGLVIYALKGIMLLELAG